MKSIKKTEQRGATMAEYALMLVVILVVAVGACRLVGTNVNNATNRAAGAIQ